MLHNALSAFLLQGVHSDGLQVLKESDEHISGKLSLSTLLDVVAPVLQQFILEGKAAEDSGHEIKQVRLPLLITHPCIRQLVAVGTTTMLFNVYCACDYTYLCHAF